MPVQQHVLNWLYSVLTSEYHDVNRTYNDVAQAITRYPTLAPRTDVHTFPNGASALLLHLSGTIPVAFRGSTYRFPLSVWVPHAYPREPPLVYVTPTESMVVRPGQHVDPQGQVYHPYLANWAQYWDKSTLPDFLGVLSDVFAKEPPVISRQQSRPTQSPATVHSPPPVPPPHPRADSHPQPQATPPTHSQSSPRPPPPPPKPGQDARPTSRAPFDGRGPPLPPVPTVTQNGTRPSRYDSAPPLPPQQNHDVPHSRAEPYSHPSRQSSMNYSSPQLPQGAPSARPPSYYPESHMQRPPGQPGTQWMPHGQPSGYNQPSHQQPAQQQQAPPPPDLMDEPLTLSIPSQSSVAPPPIPRNPEKDAMVRQLAQTLAASRARSRQDNESNMKGLQAQQAAMLAAMSGIQAEMGQLTQLSALLTTNENILREALQRADTVIEGSKNHPAPDMDELLVAPTVVSNQLYTLVAEERALGDAIFMLGRAVERGRVSPAVFAKMTRSLAREWYLKKALVHKIGQGMGLAS